MKKYILLVGFLSLVPCIRGQQPPDDQQRILNHILSQNPGGTINDQVDRILADPNQSAQTKANAALALAYAYQSRGAMWDTLKYMQVTKQLLQPRTIGYLALGALGVFAAWHATSLVRDVANYYIMVPPLATKTSIKSWGATLKEFFIYEDEELPPQEQVILNDDLTARAADLTQSLIDAVQNESFFRHYLFYGPTGTGKTMLALAMARESGLEYMYFSASRLMQYSEQEGVRQLTHLFEYAKAYPKKLMIIMDEGDAVFGNRDTLQSAKALQFISTILTHSGTEQANFVLVVLTNRPYVFDTAGRGRFGEKLKIDAPQCAERKRMFDLYFRKYLIDFHTVDLDKRAFYQKLFSWKPKQRKELFIAEDVFADLVFDRLAYESEGLVGRDISDVMLSVQSDAYKVENHTVTKEMLFNALDRKKTQDREIAAYAAS